MKTTIKTELPQELVAQARAFVEQGWAGDLDELLADALRRYLESHSLRLTESFVREDVNWGLHGRGVKRPHPWSCATPARSSISMKWAASSCWQTFPK